MRSFKPIRDEALSLLAGLGILLLLLAVIFCSFVSLFSACSLYEDRVITEQTREDGAYTVKLLQTSEENEVTTSRSPSFLSTSQ